MNYENLYKNALERARVWKEKSGMPADKQGILDDIFPELKESEDEKVRKELLAWLKNTEGQVLPMDRYNAALAWLEKQGKKNPAFEMKTPEESLGIDSDTYNKIVDECIYDGQKSQRMISAEAKEAMYNKPADTVEQKCEESKTKIFDAPTPFEDKLYAFVAACEFLTLPAKIEFIKEHSQEILDVAREQIGKEQSSTWSKEDEKEYKYVLKFVDNILNNCGNKKDYEHCKRCYDWLKSLKPQNR